MKKYPRSSWRPAGRAAGTRCRTYYTLKVLRSLQLTCPPGWNNLPQPILILSRLHQAATQGPRSTKLRPPRTSAVELPRPGPRTYLDLPKAKVISIRYIVLPHTKH